MKKYLYEMHAHTSESSSCARVCAEDVVKQYKSLGYDGIVITDHMSEYKMKRKNLTEIKDKADYFLTGYRKAKELETEDFKVLLGMELSFMDYDGDFLIYGLTEELLYECHWDQFHEIEDFRPFADEHDLLIFQAHPFRFNMTVIDPKYLDGMEVYNGHHGHESHNFFAEKWAELYGLKPCSGSDFHEISDKMKHGGIYFDSRITTTAQLRDTLRSGEYLLKTDKFIL